MKVSTGYIGQASIVLQYATDMVDGVISGAISLNDAYAEAQQRKAVAQSQEGKMERLRKDAPDLADQVTEERLTLAEAIGAMEARKRRAASNHAATKTVSAHDWTRYNSASADSMLTLGMLAQLARSA